MRRYLEVNSTYRDRNKFPLAGSFNIPVSQTGRRTQVDAVDPVSLASPLSAWTSNRINANISGSSLSLTVASIVSPNMLAGSSTNTSFIVQAPSGSLQREENYYRALPINNTTIDVIRRIECYKYLGTDSGGVNDRAIIVVDTGWPDSFALGDSLVINDPTDVSNPSEPFFFVPNGRLGTNAYSGFLLYNESIKDSRWITSYNTITNLLCVNTSSVTGGPVNGWLATHNYSLRKDMPNSVMTVGAGSTITNVILVGGPTVDGSFVNEFIRIKAATYGNHLTSPENESRRVTSYSGSTMTATVYPPFSSTPPTGNDVEVLLFSYDNLSPFVYTGSTVAHQEMVCYEIELLNLVLPNQTLAVGEGSRIAFYPYVYVSIANVSGAGAGINNIMYSNNPNATKMAFRAAVSDISNQLSSSFIKLDGSKMTQTIKFKPNDTLSFSVTLPNGQIYDTVIPERYSPDEPNALIQISAMFSLHRVA